MTDRTTVDDRWLDWLAEAPAHAPTGLLDEVLAELPNQRRRRGWGVGAAADRLLRYGVAVAAGAGLTIGLLAVASGLQPNPGPVVPGPTASPQASAAVRHPVRATVLTEPM